MALPLVDIDVYLLELSSYLPFLTCNKLVVNLFLKGGSYRAYNLCYFWYMDEMRLLRKWEDDVLR